MPSRSYLIPAAILWFTSTSWLFSTKILPTLTAGKAPNYAELLPTTVVTNPAPVRWNIRWNDQKIGWAENRISRSVDGTGKIVSEVQFEQLPVEKLLHDAMGILSRFSAPITHGNIGPLDLRVLTILDFDNYGILSQFETTVDVGDLAELLQIEGNVHGETMDLVARVEMGHDARQEIFRRKEIRLPPDALVADTFSPRPKLTNLRVGQKWTFQSYRPLMPHSPLELIEATVEHEELIAWDSKMVRARKVAYRRDAGSGISSTRRPISESWVLENGTVLRQDLWLGNVKVQFVRVKTGTGTLAAAKPDSPSAANSDNPKL